jgi:hypothetical protein
MRGILIYEFWSINPGETQDFKSIILHNLLTVFKNSNKFQKPNSSQICCCAFRGLQWGFGIQLGLLSSLCYVHGMGIWMIVRRRTERSIQRGKKKKKKTWCRSSWEGHRFGLLDRCVSGLKVLAAVLHPQEAVNLQLSQLQQEAFLLALLWSWVDRSHWTRYPDKRTWSSLHDHTAELSFWLIAPNPVAAKALHPMLPWNFFFKMPITLSLSSLLLHGNARD